MNLLSYVISPEWRYTIDCSCGGTVVLGTNGDGLLTESCLACRAFRVVPSGGAFSRPVAELVTSDLADLEAERSRKNLPKCQECHSRRVGNIKSTRCSVCATTRKRELDRASQQRHRDKVAAERAA